jgi:hypothetical protein
MLQTESLGGESTPVAPDSAPVVLVAAGTVAGECNVVRRTIGRWFLNPAVGFPAPIQINRRLYFRRHEIEA